VREGLIRTDSAQYFENFAKKYDLFPYIKLNSKVTSAIWDEAKGIYNLKINSEGKEIEDWCHVLINGTGFLNVCVLSKITTRDLLT
jgi:cation diffusion facilitator CzcD-associated flavoprotein CzcO